MTRSDMTRSDMTKDAVSQSKHIHIIGIAGSAMSPLAGMLREQGYRSVGVTGISLGGSIVMLLACLERTPDYIVPIVAHLELGEAVESAEILWRKKQDLERFGGSAATLVERVELTGRHEMTCVAEVRCRVIRTDCPPDTVEMGVDDGVDVVRRKISGGQLLADPSPPVGTVRLGALLVERHPGVDHDAPVAGAHTEAAHLELQHETRFGDLEREIGDARDGHRLSLAP